jgi:hypothetical protein
MLAEIAQRGLVDVESDCPLAQSLGEKIEGFYDG